MSNRVVDMAGRYYGRLYVLRRSNSDARGQAMWLCLCDCGATSTVRGCCLRKGNTESCGCLHAEKVARLRPRFTHGKCRSPEWRTWSSMRCRCGDPRNQDWDCYGGRGISVCSRWENFENFLSDMGPRPAGKTLDRIDSNGNYEPGNCRWATGTEQQNNRRNNRRIEYAGRTQTLTEWARETGLQPDTLRFRLKSGWPLERALSEPLHAQKSH